MASGDRSNTPKPWHREFCYAHSIAAKTGSALRICEVQVHLTWPLFFGCSLERLQESDLAKCIDWQRVSGFLPTFIHPCGWSIRASLRVKTYGRSPERLATINTAQRRHPIQRCKLCSQSSCILHPDNMPREIRTPLAFGIRFWYLLEHNT